MTSMKEEWEELFSIRKPKDPFERDDYNEMINERAIQLLIRWCKHAPKELAMNKRSYLPSFLSALEKNRPCIQEIHCRAQTLSGTFRDFCGDFIVTPKTITFTDCSQMKESYQYIHIKRIRYPTIWTETSTYERIL
jgi:hypothetical protein